MQTLGSKSFFAEIFAFLKYWFLNDKGLSVCLFLATTSVDTMNKIKKST